MTAPGSATLRLSLLGDRSLAYRDGLERWSGAERLRGSIRRRGLLEPVTVWTGGGEPRLVAGFRRIQALEELGAVEVPARLTEAPLEELFVAAVESHAGQPANLREVARAVRVGVGLGWTLEQAARRLLPALALEPHPRLAGRYLGLLDLPAELLQLFVDKGFSLRRCLPFCALDPGAAGTLAALVRTGLVRGGRQLEEVACWLVEAAAREGIMADALAGELGLLDPGAAPALARLEARRFPEVSRRRRELDALCSAVAGGEQARLRVSYDRNLADEELQVILRLASPDDLDLLLPALGRSRGQLAAILARLRGDEP